MVLALHSCEMRENILSSAENSPYPEGSKNERFLPATSSIATFSIPVDIQCTKNRLLLTHEMQLSVCWFDILWN